MQKNQIIKILIGCILVASTSYCSIMENIRQNNPKYIESHDTITAYIKPNGIANSYRYAIDGIEKKDGNFYYDHPAVLQYEIPENCPKVINKIDKYVANGYVTKDDVFSSQETGLSKPWKLSDLRARCVELVKLWENKKVLACAKRGLAKTETLSAGKWIETADYFRYGVADLIDCKDYINQSSLGAYAADASRIKKVCTVGPAKYVGVESFQRNYQSHRNILFQCYLKKEQVWRDLVNREF